MPTRRALTFSSYWGNYQTRNPGESGRRESGPAHQFAQLPVRTLHFLLSRLQGSSPPHPTPNFLTPCATLGKLLNCSLPQTPPLYMGRVRNSISECGGSVHMSSSYFGKSLGTSHAGGESLTTHIEFCVAKTCDVDTSDVTSHL